MLDPGILLIVSSKLNPLDKQTNHKAVQLDRELQSWFNHASPTSTMELPSANIRAIIGP